MKGIPIVIGNIFFPWLCLIYYLQVLDFDNKNHFLQNLLLNGLTNRLKNKSYRSSPPEGLLGKGILKKWIYRRTPIPKCWCSSALVFSFKPAAYVPSNIIILQFIKHNIIFARYSNVLFTILIPRFSIFSKNVIMRFYFVIYFFNLFLQIHHLAPF